MKSGFYRMRSTIHHLLNHLWLKLMAAFVLVIVLVVLVTVILTRQGADTQFAHFMVDGQMIRTTRLLYSLAGYYQQQQNWANLDTQLEQVLREASDGTMNRMMSGMMGMLNNRMKIVDINGEIVADTDARAGAPLLPIQQWPITIRDQQVGTLWVEGSMMGHAHLDDAQLLRGVTRAVIVAGSIAGLVALLLAGLLVRQITHPLASLIQASRSIAAGDLQIRVRVQSHDELGDLAATFNQMASTLETQETLRRNLIADVAHELRTPLAGIQGTVEAFQDGIFASTAENFAIIHEEVMLLNRLVEDLRTLANAEAGKLSLDLMPTDLVALVQRQVTTFQYKARERGVTLTMTAAQTIIPIAGDAQRLEQVLNNLLDNALRHTAADGAILVRLVNVKNGVQITVTDNGEGIPATALSSLFERFYRVDPIHNQQIGGSGLGLAIARQLVEAHGGQIWVTSPPPGSVAGSEFGLFLPAT